MATTDGFDLEEEHQTVIQESLLKQNGFTEANSLAQRMSTVISTLPIELSKQD
jgi:hypothetical protein